MNIIKFALTLTALVLSVPLRADQHAADSSRAYSRSGRDQLKRFDNAVNTGDGRVHPDLPVMSVRRHFNNKDWIQQIRWNEATGFINEFAFPLPFVGAKDFKTVSGAELTDSGWVQVEFEGARYEFSVRKVDKIYFRVQRRLLMPQLDIQLDSLNARQLKFYVGKKCIYEFNLPEQIGGEILSFKLAGSRLAIETSLLRRDTFDLRRENGEIALDHARFGQRVLDLVDLKADSKIFAPDCKTQLTTPR